MHRLKSMGPPKNRWLGVIGCNCEELVLSMQCNVNLTQAERDGLQKDHRQTAFYASCGIAKAVSHVSRVIDYCLRRWTSCVLLM